MPRESDLVNMAMGSRFAPPRLYGYPSNPRIIDLIMHRGAVQADAARHSGELWGNALANIGAQVGGAIQQHQASKEMAKRDAAWLEFVNGGEWLQDPRAAYSRAVQTWGPEEGRRQFEALTAAAQLGQPKRDRAADEKALVSLARGMDGMTPEGRAAVYPQAAALVKNVYPDFEVPPDYDESWWDQAIRPAIRGMEPAPKLERVAPGESLVDPATGEATYTAPPKPDKPPEPRVVGRSLVDPSGKVLYRDPTEPRQQDRMWVIRDGKPARVAESDVRPGDQPWQAPQNQRLTKDERQDFAAWDYALPKLEGFARYVQGNPGKWGKWDAFRQGLAQAVPGFADADYASQAAFIGRINAEIRHALFGAALTEGEKESAKQFLVHPTDQPAVILAKITEASNRARSQHEYYKSLGFNLPPSSAPRSGGPARVNSRADYDKLPPGTLFQAPDGTLRRKP